jgi:hypothetical protein
METISQREQSLQLFHLLGKLLYNKREQIDGISFGSASAQYAHHVGYGDSARDDVADGPHPVRNELPDHLLAEGRKPSKVDLIVEYKKIYICPCGVC